MYNLLKIFILQFIFIASVDANEIKPEAFTWNDGLKEELFEGNKLLNGQHLFSLVTPYRAEDAAMVPISVKFFENQENKSFVNKLYIVVDENPAPLVAIFNMTTKTGNAEISTRVRVDKYTYIRAIAEYNDGKTFMVSNRKSAHFWHFPIVCPKTSPWFPI